MPGLCACVLVCVWLVLSIFATQAILSWAEELREDEDEEEDVSAVLANPEVSRLLAMLMEESDDSSEEQHGEDAGGNRPGVVVQKREVMEVCLLLHVVLIHHLWRRPVENHLAPAHFFHGQQKKA